MLKIVWKRMSDRIKFRLSCLHGSLVWCIITAAVLYHLRLWRCLWIVLWYHKSIFTTIFSRVHLPQQLTSWNTFSMLTWNWSMEDRSSTTKHSWYATNYIGIRNWNVSPTNCACLHIMLFSVHGLVGSAVSSRCLPVTLRHPIYAIIAVHNSQTSTRPMD